MHDYLLRPQHDWIIYRYGHVLLLILPLALVRKWFVTGNQNKLKADLILDIDSELHFSSHDNQSFLPTVSPTHYTNPIRAIFSATHGFESTEKLSHIHQCKGEAEMAQIDWLMEYVKQIELPTTFTSIVTSGDIDSVVLHMFALSHLWPRLDSYGTFKNDVYVILQKPGGKFDIFNVTNILRVLENGWKDCNISMKLALVLSLGGNDYLPKLYGISHSNTVDTFLKHQYFRDELFRFDDMTAKNVSLDVAVYKQFVKFLYSPKNIDPFTFSYDEIRQISIRNPTLKNQQQVRNPQTWMPPASAVEHLAKNLNCLIKYYFTAGKCDAQLPNFLQEGCLKRLQNGEIEYNLGDEAYINDISECFLFSNEHLLSKMKPAKRKHAETPQKGRRRKRNLTSTPRKPKDEQKQYEDFKSNI